VTTVDWIALAVVAACAFGGWRRGLIASSLSLAGLIVGAYAGSRIAPHLLHGGADSQWTPLASLAGAFAGAAILQTLGSIVGSLLRGGLRLTPFRFLDSAGGVAVGALTGIVVVWVAGATAVLVPGQTGIRREVLRSHIVRALNDTVSPRRVLHLLARIDPFPSIAGPAAPAKPPQPAFARRRAVRAAERSVVRVLGTACGLGIEGSGWFVTPQLVVTAAHVVAGENDTTVQIPGRRGTYPALVVAFDAHDDVAVLRVTGTEGTALRTNAPVRGTPVAVLGYPEDGPLTAAPGRVGETATFFSRDTYGRATLRPITAVAADVRHGDSGGPAVDAQGRVMTTIFAARIGGGVGYGVPIPTVLGVVGKAQGPVSTGACSS